MTKPKTAATRQREWRERQAERVLRLEAGYREVLGLLDGNDKPLAVRLREIAHNALGASK